MKAALARAAYSTLLRLATPLYLARLLWRSRREPLYRMHLGERLGFAAGGGAGGSGNGTARAPGALWLHAVSLGETRAAAALVDELRRQRPGLRLLLTHGTATGRAAGVPLLREGDAQAWLPYDTPGAVRRFLAAWRPAAGVIMETEVWPNLLHEAAAAGVPLVLANARLSERSQRKGERFAALMRPAAACLTLALAQTEADAKRLREAGVREVQVPGNLKFDMAPAPALLQAGQRWRAALEGRAVVMFAASREGEEAALLDAWRRALAPAAEPGPGPAAAAARPLLLVVPRHPQRFDEVAALVAARGFTLARRSDWNAATAGAGTAPVSALRAGTPPVSALRAGTPPVSALRADVWLGDSMGEMPLYYALASLALLGGSFAPLGGQNLIEAAACACPVLMGPHTFNFAQAAEGALAAGAADRVADLDAAVGRAIAWLGEPQALAERSRRATAFAAEHRGAAARVAAAVLALLPGA
ncbi:MAG: 3-deoxy-D-manno-octulosonic acid transferase [Rubrivivax sp.]|nr:3-deoxy-D-manno-octulosonic acid transferase [Rubrivivax sp.]